MDGQDRLSHTRTWIVSAVTVLLLYLLSWGPVKVHYRTPHDMGSLTLFLDGSPGWIKKFYYPIDVLCEIGFVQKTAEAYFAWCDRVMH